VKDVARSIDFYTKQLGFKQDMQHLPAFGQVSVGNLKLILSGPGASGSRVLPDGRQQEPGGWNRIVLEVKDLPARIEELQRAGVHFRNEMEVGPGGKQVQLEDRMAIRLSCSSRLASRFDLTSGPIVKDRRGYPRRSLCGTGIPACPFFLTQVGF
jgi:glyoxylase I family protein